MSFRNKPLTSINIQRTSEPVKLMVPLQDETSSRLRNESDCPERFPLSVSLRIRPHISPFGCWPLPVHLIVYLGHFTSSIQYRFLARHMFRFIIESTILCHIIFWMPTFYCILYLPWNCLILLYWNGQKPMSQLVITQLSDPFVSLTCQISTVCSY